MTTSENPTYDKIPTLAELFKISDKDDRDPKQKLRDLIGPPPISLINGLILNEKIENTAPRGSFITQYDCGAGDEGTPSHRDSCPVCGATVAGNDEVNGICQIMAFIGRPIGDWITRGVR